MTPDLSFLIPWLQFPLLIVVLLVFAIPLGRYMARVLDGEISFLNWIERPIYRVAGIQTESQMGWKDYATSLVLFTVASILTLFLILLMQPYPEISVDLAINAAVSFVTNTNWQPNTPETSISTSSQMIGLAVQNFLSASVGLTIMAAFIRGLSQPRVDSLGNFWVDLTRTVLYIFLPLSIILALFLVAQGVVQTFGEIISYLSIENSAQQTLMTGPVASQVAIKQLGTNGGGYFAANAAHPFENPTPLSNFIQTLAILLIPAASPVCFGKMVGNPKQGYILLIAILSVFIPLSLYGAVIENGGNPVLAQMEISQSQLGNMEGKEVRIGTIASSLWASAATATGNGSTNAALDSFLPLSSMIALVFTQIGENIFGGAGTGLCGVLIYTLLTVFMAGLMIGRTPEYLGKKIGVYEMKMVSLVIIIPVLLSLLVTAIVGSSTYGVNAVHNPGPQGYTEILYAVSSASNNNGSALAGFDGDTVFFNIVLAFCMLANRLGLLLPLLAIAGSMAKKNSVPPSLGTLDTTSTTFCIFLVIVMSMLSALTFIPSIALGPVAEHFHMLSVVRGAP